MIKEYVLLFIATICQVAGCVTLLAVAALFFKAPDALNILIGALFVFVVSGGIVSLFRKNIKWFFDIFSWPF